LGIPEAGGERKKGRSINKKAACRNKLFDKLPFALWTKLKSKRIKRETLSRLSSVVF